MQYEAKHWNTMQYNTMHCDTMQYNTTKYNTMQCNEKYICCLWRRSKWELEPKDSAFQGLRSLDVTWQSAINVICCSSCDKGVSDHSSHHPPPLPQSINQLLSSFVASLFQSPPTSSIKRFVKTYKPDPLIACKSLRRCRTGEIVAMVLSSPAWDRCPIRTNGSHINSNWIVSRVVS